MNRREFLKLLVSSLLAFLFRFAPNIKAVAEKESPQWTYLPAPLPFWLKPTERNLFYLPIVKR